MRIVRTLFLLAGVVLLTPACTLKFVDNGTPPPPRYPRAAAIQTRAYQQVDRIEDSVRRGDLDEDIADALADNDDSVLELNYYFQNSFTPARDLVRSEALLLGSMLDDNETLYADAVNRRRAWRWYFNRGFETFPASPADRGIYGVYIHYQVKVQYYQIQTQEKAGRLSPAMAEELRQRVAYIRDLRLQDIREVGRLDLGRERIHRLKVLVDDNNRFLKAKTKGSNKEWGGDRSRDWEDQKKTTRPRYFKEDRWRNEGHRPDRGKKKGWTTLEDEDVAPPTPIPALRPTATPLPDLREIDGNDPLHRGKRKRENGRPEKDAVKTPNPVADPSEKKGTGQQDQKVTAPTPVPEVKPTAVPSPVPQGTEGDEGHERTGKPDHDGATTAIEDKGKDHGAVREHGAREDKGGKGRPGTRSKNLREKKEGSEGKDDQGSRKDTKEDKDQAQEVGTPEAKDKDGGEDRKKDGDEDKDKKKDEGEK